MDLTRSLCTPEANLPCGVSSGYCSLIVNLRRNDRTGAGRVIEFARADAASEKAKAPPFRQSRSRGSWTMKYSARVGSREDGCHLCVWSYLFLPGAERGCCFLSGVELVCRVYKNGLLCSSLAILIRVIPIGKLVTKGFIQSLILYSK